MSKTLSPRSSKQPLNPTSFEARFGAVLGQIYTPRFRGDVWDLLESQCVLPHSVRTSRVDRRTSPWIIDPVRAICTREKKEQTILKPVQGSGTTIIDLLVQYIVLQAPGQTWLNVQKKEAADSVAEKRFLPMLKKNRLIAPLLPKDANKVRKEEIVFDHMPFKVQAAIRNNLQSESLPWVINDEVWLWADVGLLEMARKRIDAVWNGSMINVSQGSVAEDHLDSAFKEGKQNEWSLVCPECKQLQRFKWFEKDGDQRPKPGGIKWDDRLISDDGSMEIDRLLKTVHYQCENRACLFPIPDELPDRRRLADAGRYESTNDNPHPEKDSWRWNALTVYWIPWKKLTLEWFKAQEAKRSGNYELLKLFLQQRMAQMWENRQMLSTSRVVEGGYSYLEFTEGQPVENEAGRFMTIDFQNRSFVCNIRAWKVGVLGSQLLRFEEVPTADDARALQLRYGVANSDTFLDIRWNTAEGARILTRWQEVDERGRITDWGWTGLMGEERDFYIYHPNSKTKPIQRPFSTFNYSVTEAGKRYRYMLFSNLRIKDTLFALRSGESVPWEAPHDVPQKWRDQLDTEYRATVRGKSGEMSKIRWLPIRKHIQNHAWDTEVHQTLAACVAGFIKHIEVAVTPEEGGPEDGSEQG